MAEEAAAAAEAAAEAAAAQEAADLQDLVLCLGVCGISTATLVGGITEKEGYLSLRQFSRVKHGEIAEMAKNLRTRRTGSVHYSDNQIRALKALSFWLNELTQLGEPLDASLWTIEKREEIEDRMRAEGDKPETKPTLSDVKKWSSIEYDACMASFRAYLAQLGLEHICRDAVPPSTFADDRERRLYSLRFDTPEGQEADRSGFRQLKLYLVDTDAWSWIKPYEKGEKGRAAFLALDRYYSGPGEVNKRVAYAKAQLKKAHWKSETSYPFETFVSNIRSAFATLDRVSDEKYSERKKVEYLQQVITPTENRLVTHVQILSVQYPKDFDGALTHMSTEIAKVYAGVQQQQESKKRRAISDVNTRGGGRGRGNEGGRGGGRGNPGGGRGNPGGGRGGGRGGRGGRSGRGRGRGGRSGRGGPGSQASYGSGGTFLSDIDVSNPHRTFTAEEYQTLQANNQWQFVLMARNQQNRGGGGGYQQGGYQQGPPPQVNVSGLGTNNASQMSQITDDQSHQSNQQSQGSRGGRNGAGFGPGAHNRN